jgi:5'-methylthioadenosine phosphorylase
MIAIIGGSGVYDPEILQDVKDVHIETEYGAVSLKSGVYQGKKVLFLARHGGKHSVPPHMVNYRANIKALKDLKVEHIVSTSAVGSLKKEMKPGDFVLLDQFVDFTNRRSYTFFDDEVVHTDVSEPYCPQLREVIMKAASYLGIHLFPKGVYVCTEGPRYETPAEIKMYALLGCDVVGMTNVPEVVLAREAKICYASIAVVTNFAAGVYPSRISHEEVIEIMNEKNEMLKKLLCKTLEIIPEGQMCDCCG